MPGFRGHLGFSIGSHSVSAHSGSHAGSHITSAGHSSVEQGSSLGHWLIGKDKLSPALRKHLVEELNLNAAYTNRSATGLHFVWGHYLECTAALAGNWPSDIPAFTEWMVIEVLIGRSTWYANYVPAFGAIADEEAAFPEMRDWLDSPPEQVLRSDTKHLWGIRDQLSFTMEEIKKWQENGGTLDKNYSPTPSPEPDGSSKGKGKVKAQGKSHRKLK